MALKVKAITNATTNLAGETPFTFGFVVHNTTGGSLVLQHSHDGSDWATAATVAAGAYQQVDAPRQYVRVSTAATLYVLA
jgi:hypothetical protein